MRQAPCRTAGLAGYSSTGSLGTGLVAARVPDRYPCDVLRDRHRVIVKMVEKQWFNGIRLSPHIFNTEAEVDAALAAIRVDLT